jgi:hypothetical protein
MTTEQVKVIKGKSRTIAFRIFKETEGMRICDAIGVMSLAIGKTLDVFAKAVGVNRDELYDDFVRLLEEWKKCAEGQNES